MKQQSGGPGDGSGPASADDSKGFDAVLLDELTVLRPNESANGPSLDQLYDTISNLTVPLSALCLSGGGIRSASFALGVIQGLARFKVLGEFDYLSTVSGGGYIGSWLTAWRCHARDDQSVFAALDRTTHKSGDEAPQIQGLRANSNYITPKLGLLSADTWTAIALTIRNLVLNWAVFVPFFMGVLYFPWLCFDLLCAAKKWPWTVEPLMILGIALTTIGLAVASYGRRRAAKPWLADGRFVLLVLCPIVLAAMAFTTAVAAFIGSPAPVPLPSLYMASAAGAVCYFAAWLLATLFRPWRPGGQPNHAEAIKDLPVWVVAGAIAGGLLKLGMHLGVGLDSAYQTEWLTVLGSSWTMLAIFGGELVYVGLRSYAIRGDMDREWLGRAAGWLTAGALTWALVAAVALFGVHAVDQCVPYSPRCLPYSIAGMVVGGASGITAVSLAASARTVATTAAEVRKRLSFAQIASVAAVIFAIFLAVCLSLLDQAASKLMSENFPRIQDWAVDVAGFLLLIALAAGISYFVNINRFSLHSVYRNRLVRAFLGSARAGADPSRAPDPFTGFDQADNPKMATMEHTPGAKLHHVVNITLNVVSTDNLAWQERKAEPFTVTPRWAGAGNPKIGYRPTRDYGGKHGGISLGTAFAVSGAAVSPNMGYHSSPLLGFLLMLFNVRLGWWLGNPGKSSYRNEGPDFGIVPLLKELASQTTDSGRWVYLSDGGHFENLGLYEMVRRRCRMIVVSDAGHDPDCAIEDLGNAVRKIYIDLGVSIDFDTFSLAARQVPPKSGSYCAVGRITYPEARDKPGWVIYIKPGYHGNESAQIRSYATAHKDFPHESTANQWFGESQFEAYRALGAHIAELICSGGLGEPSVPIKLRDLKHQAEAYLTSAAAAPAGPTARKYASPLDFA